MPFVDVLSRNTITSHYYRKMYKILLNQQCVNVGDVWDAFNCLSFLMSCSNAYSIINQLYRNKHVSVSIIKLHPSPNFFEITMYLFQSSNSIHHLTVSE